LAVFHGPERPPSRAHRRRVESRSVDISGHKQPTWVEVVNRDYEAWDRDHPVPDTATDSVDRLVDRAEAYIREAGR
jgi:hypothetical protein